MRECAICGEPFEVHYPNQKYCEECRINPRTIKRRYDLAKKRLDFHSGIYDGKNNEKICMGCGIKYTTKGDYRFCSKECEAKSRVKKASCSNCGKNLYDMCIIINNVKGANFCCEECKQEHRWKSARANGHISICTTCKKEFIGNRLYCSKECRDVARANGTYQPLKYDSTTTEVLCKACKKPFEVLIAKPEDFCPDCKPKIAVLMEQKREADRKYRIEQEEKKKLADYETNGMCFYCHTSNSKCIRLKSNFTCYPTGSKLKDNKVVECPCFTEINPNAKKKKF